jgi:hypothetical protein
MPQLLDEHAHIRAAVASFATPRAPEGASAGTPPDQAS